MIQFTVDGSARISKSLSEFAGEYYPQAVDTFGREARTLIATYPPYSYVTRRAAYPDAHTKYPARWIGKNGEPVTPVPGFFSAAQHRFVMAGIAQGTITPGASQRTGKLGAAWKWDGKKITNGLEYARYVQGQGTQSRHEIMVGWQPAAVIVREKTPDIIKKVEQVVAGLLARKFAQRGPLT